MADSERIEVRQVKRPLCILTSVHHHVTVRRCTHFQLSILYSYDRNEETALHYLYFFACTPMATFEEVRARLARRCSSKKLDLGAEVHAVTFQPLASRSNEDRLVVQEIPVSGQKWLLMVVCDGASSLPDHGFPGLANTRRMTW